MSTILAAKPAVAPMRRHLAAAPIVDAVDRAGIPLRSMNGREQRALCHARARGWLTVAAADLLACHLLHEHPAMVWGNEWWDAQS